MKSFAVGQRPAKRLFTPEIKRFLKEWLIRRRENPYPNREEKKILAVDTGLTYIQICNWFANWRRKLKNAGNERHRKTWGHLIKTYNNHAQGNVEQFSIRSDDSIWSEPDPACADTSDSPGDHCYSTAFSLNTDLKTNTFSKLQISQADSHYNAQCYLVSSTTEEYRHDPSSLSASNNGNKYKNHIIEKYLREMDPQPPDLEEGAKPPDATSQPVVLNKWLESAAKFQPCQSNYLAWDTGARKQDKKRRQEKGAHKPAQSRANLAAAYRPHDLKHYSQVPADGAAARSSPAMEADPCIHGQEEVDAAVTLTKLASLYRP